MMHDYNKQAEVSWDVLVLYSNGQIDDQEHDRLYEMIFSPDPENLAVADQCVKQLKERRKIIYYGKENLSDHR